MKDAIVFHHNHCFDAVAAAVCAADYLENIEGWKIKKFEPVTYTTDDSWIQRDLPEYSAVLDFLYQPKAKFWVDHHGTTFAPNHPELEEHYKEGLKDPSRTLIYDKSYPSGAGLLWEHIKDFVTDRPRYEEMVRWANITDTATYDTPYQAVFGDEPALRIASTLGSKDPEHIEKLIKALRTGTIEEVATLPSIEKHFLESRPKIEMGLKEITKRLEINEEKDIMVYETKDQENVSLPRFGPFLIRPDITYMISLVHGEKGSKISASRNPWGRETKAALGTIFREYGGGGHHGVGSLQLPPGNVEKSREMLRGVIASIRKSESEHLQNTGQNR